MTAFQALPTPPDAPLSVGSFELGSAMTYTDASVGSPSTITLRIARLPADLGFPTDNPPQDPEFLLGAGGPVAAVPRQPSKLSVVDQNGASIATANYLPDTFDTYRIVITVQRPGTRTWTLHIRNDDKQSRSFTAVVASDDDDARRPWIDVPPGVQSTKDASSSAVISAHVPAQNYGTGTLTMEPKSGPRSRRLTRPPPVVYGECSFPDGCGEYEAPHGDPWGDCVRARCGHARQDHYPA